MARSFDGTDDNINFGSDAGIDNVFAAAPNTGSVACHFKRGATGTVILISKLTDAVADLGWRLSFRGAGGSHVAIFLHSWDATVTSMRRETLTQFSSTTLLYSLLATYDGSSTTTVANVFVNGAADNGTDGSSARTTIDSEATLNCRAGESDSGLGDFNGVIGWITVTKTILTAADANRHYWWGCAPGGPSTMLVWHPLWTDDLANKGTGTANGTATGTTMASLPRVERCWGAMMGCGR